jgi:hypothetical protein
MGSTPIVVGARLSYLPIRSVIEHYKWVPSNESWETVAVSYGIAGDERASDAGVGETMLPTARVSSAMRL